MKLTSDLGKASLPGRVGIARHYDGDGYPTHDVLYDVDAPPAETGDSKSLLESVMREGALVAELPSPTEARARALAGVGSLPAEVARLACPLRYSVELDERLALLRERLSGAAHRAKAS
jgi:hypothetical protein